MAQTPKSVSANVNSTTGQTIYTVPAATTAVVKSIIPSSQLSSQSITVNKVSGGTVYPIVYSQTFPTVNATGATNKNSPNLLDGPITLAANESISVSVSNASALYGKSVFNSSNTLPQLASGSPAFQNVLYSNGIYMCVGYINSTGGYLPQYQGFAITSSDGVNWTYSTGFPTGYSVLRSLANNGSTTWVAAGDDGNSGTSSAVWTSTNNGSTWTKYTLSGGLYLTQQVWYLNGNFIVSDYLGNLYKSTDGVSWTQVTATRLLMVGDNTGSGSQGITTANYVGGTYYFGTRNGVIQSTDLVTFQAQYQINTMSGATSGNFCYGIDYLTDSNSYWALIPFSRNAVNIGGVLFSSTDGVNWTWNSALASSFSSNYVLASNLLVEQVACVKSTGNPKIYLRNVTDGTDTTVTYSLDGGATWTQGNTSGSHGWKGPFFGLSNGGLLCFQGTPAFAGNGVGIVAPGTNYVSSISSTNSLASLGFVGNNMRVAHASDGTNWVAFCQKGQDTNNVGRFGGSNNSSINTITNLGAVSTYGNPVACAYLPATGKFYYMGDNGTIWSFTGYSGTFTGLNTLSYFAGVNISLTVVGTKLVANVAGTMYTSTDGITWTKQTSAGNWYPLGGYAAWGNYAISNSAGTNAVVASYLNQTQTTTDGTTYTSMPMPDGLSYSKTVNGTTFLTFNYSNVLINRTGSASGFFTVTNPLSFATYTKLFYTWQSPLFSGASGTAWKNNAYVNNQLITYDGTRYIFAVGSDSGLTMGITTSTDLLNFSYATGANVQALNGFNYNTASSGDIGVTSNGAGNVIFNRTTSPVTGLFSTTGATINTPTIVTAGIVEVS